MAEIEISVTIECKCDECGDALDSDFESKRGKNIVIVKPCEKCLEEARREGA